MYSLLSSVSTKCKYNDTRKGAASRSAKGATQRRCSLSPLVPWATLQADSCKQTARVFCFVRSAWLPIVSSLCDMSRRQHRAQTRALCRSRRAPSPSTSAWAGGRQCRQPRTCSTRSCWRTRSSATSSRGGHGQAEEAPGAQPHSQLLYARGFCSGSSRAGGAAAHLLVVHGRPEGPSSPGTSGKAAAAS